MITDEGEKMSNQARGQLKRRQRGVGLIDVLVGLVVISLGVVGLARFQAVVMKEGGGAKSRSVAIQLARAKLDDLRGYTQLAAGGAGVFGYDEIGNNLGGTENGALLRLPQGSVTIGNVAYTRSWTATNYYFCGSGTAPVAANCTPAKSRPDFKALAVTIGWSDASGTAVPVTLQDTASSVDPLSGGRALISGAPQPGPIVTYVPGAAPQVIAIDVGGGQNKETTNPTPTITRHGNEFKNTIARYETIRYSATDNTITREEFTTLNCSCTQNGTGTGYNLAYAQVSKRVGVPADQFQTFECGICCRDHHDDATCNISSQGSSKANCFDPERPITDYNAVTGDHNHYTANGQLANNTGQDYVESCRMKRVDGYLRVVQDWKLVKVNAIPQSYFSTQANITAYGTYVKDLVAAVITGGTMPTGAWPTSQSVAVAGTAPLNARGIYLDYMDAATKTKWATRISANDATVYQTLPFYDVNLTKLGQWSSGSNAIATVSNEALVTEESGQNLYSRGNVRGISPGTTAITVRARLSNTGVINEFITSDPNDSVAQTSSVDVTVGTFYAVSGSISGLLSTANVLVNGVGSGGSPNVSCTVTSGSPVTFSCSVPPNWSGNITPSSSGYTFSPGSISRTNVTTAQSGLSFTATASLATSFAISGVVSPAVSTAVVTAIGSAGNPNGTCTYTVATGAYSCTVPSAWSGSVIVSACGYSFTPGAYVASNVTSDLAQDITSTTSSASSHTVSGVVNAAPTVTNVIVNAAGSSSGTCTYTMANGQYSCTVPSCWTGTVTPTTADAGILFTPTNYSYPQAVSSNLSNQNFDTSYTISGVVGQVSGAYLTGVTMTATGSAGSGNGSCTYPNTNGTYACVVPGLWNGSISPVKSGYSFSPASRAYVNVTSTNATENYSVTAVVTPTYTITATISGLSNNGANGKAKTASIQPQTGLACGTAVVSGSGPSSYTATISCTVQQGWNGTVVPNAIANNNATLTVSSGSAAFSNVTANGSVGYSCSGNSC